MAEAGSPLEPDGATLDSWTAACVAFVRERLLSLAGQPSFNLTDVDGLVGGFREPMPESGRPLPEILARLGPAFAATINTAGPGYLAFIPGGGLPSAALAGYVGLSLNRYVGVARAAPVLVEIEAMALRWLAAAMGYPAAARGIFTSGGSISNLVAIITARMSLLPVDFARGVLYASTETHASVPKAASLAGIPPGNVRLLPVDDRLRVEPRALADAIASDRRRGLEPFLVVANLGTTNTGAVDPVEDICAIAAEAGMWTHADAAYGGFFRLVDEGLVRGLERCDSITLDPHKGMFLPYGVGCLLVKDGECLRRAHESSAAYLRDLSPSEDEVNFTDYSPELSRSFRGLQVWLPLQLHGAHAFRAALKEKLDLARHAAERLAADSRFEVLDRPQLSIVAFRLRHGDDDANAKLLARVNERKRVYLSSTTVRGRLVLRICVLSFRTHLDRVDDAIRALQEEASRR